MWPINKRREEEEKERKEKKKRQRKREKERERETIKVREVREKKKENADREKKEYRKIDIHCLNVAFSLSLSRSLFTSLKETMNKGGCSANRVYIFPQITLNQACVHNSTGTTRARVTFLVPHTAQNDLA